MRGPVPLAVAASKGLDVLERGTQSACHLIEVLPFFPLWCSHNVVAGLQDAGSACLPTRLHVQ
jgi:hypothetical protein